MLSALFVNHTTARVGEVVPLAEAKVELVPALMGSEPFELVRGLRLGEDEVLTLSDEVVSIEGLWDLPMIGAERICLEHQYQALTGGPAVDLVCLDGALVRGENGALAQLVSKHLADPDKAPLSWHPDRRHHSHYYPADGLPDDCVIVLSTANLAAFRAAVSDTSQHVQPLRTRERTTLLVIIGALVKLANLDPAKPSKTAGVIESETALMGARVSARTIEDHLKRVSDAVDARSGS